MKLRDTLACLSMRAAAENKVSRGSKVSPILAGSMQAMEYLSGNHHIYTAAMYLRRPRGLNFTDQIKPKLWHNRALASTTVHVR